MGSGYRVKTFQHIHFLKEYLIGYIYISKHKGISIGGVERSVLGEKSQNSEEALYVQRPGVGRERVKKRHRTENER